MMMMMVVVVIVDTELQSFLKHMGVAWGAPGAGATPGHPRATKTIFSRHFCWNEAKMGLNLARCTPAYEIKR